MVRLRTYRSEIKSQCNITGIGVGSWSREGTSIAKKKKCPRAIFFVITMLSTISYFKLEMYILLLYSGICVTGNPISKGGGTRRQRM